MSNPQFRRIAQRLVTRINTLEEKLPSIIDDAPVSKEVSRIFAASKIDTLGKDIGEEDLRLRVKEIDDRLVAFRDTVDKKHAEYDIHLEALQDAGFSWNTAAASATIETTLHLTTHGVKCSRLNAIPDGARVDRDKNPNYYKWFNEGVYTFLGVVLPRTPYKYGVFGDVVPDVPGGTDHYDGSPYVYKQLVRYEVAKVVKDEGYVRHSLSDASPGMHPIKQGLYYGEPTQAAYSKPISDTVSVGITQPWRMQLLMPSMENAGIELSLDGDEQAVVGKFTVGVRAGVSGVPVALFGRLTPSQSFTPIKLSNVNPIYQKATQYLSAENFSRKNTNSGAFTLYNVDGAGDAHPITARVWITDITEFRAFNEMEDGLPSPHATFVIEVRVEMVSAGVVPVSQRLEMSLPYSFTMYGDNAVYSGRHGRLFPETLRPFRVAATSYHDFNNATEGWINATSDLLPAWRIPILWEIDFSDPISFNFDTLDPTHGVHIPITMVNHVREFRESLDAIDTKIDDAVGTIASFVYEIMSEFSQKRLLSLADEETRNTKSWLMSHVDVGLDFASVLTADTVVLPILLKAFGAGLKWVANEVPIHNKVPADAVLRDVAAMSSTSLIPLLRLIAAKELSAQQESGVYKLISEQYDHFTGVSGHMLGDNRFRALAPFCELWLTQIDVGLPRASGVAKALYSTFGKLALSVKKFPMHASVFVFWPFVELGQIRRRWMHFSVGSYIPESDIADLIVRSFESNLIGINYGTQTLLDSGEWQDDESTFDVQFDRAKDGILVDSFPLRVDFKMATAYAEHMVESEPIYNFLSHNCQHMCFTLLKYLTGIDVDREYTKSECQSIAAKFLSLYEDADVLSLVELLDI
jgi:hypothetical protein